MFIATNYFIDSITDIIISQSVVRGYIVRCDPASFKESLIAAQMEVEREELIAAAKDAREKEEEAERRAIEVLEFEKVRKKERSCELIKYDSNPFFRRLQPSERPRCSSPSRAATGPGSIRFWRQSLNRSMSVEVRN
ncbi:hypothetical protein TL16_g01017 [Triparma laevis f. inornata]|uniref:Uncharacterized protein n=1 Tax=Triparma laevis f. inornata TaxID=1714386 RepID=A0A9W7DUR6_9STRA|nr:hypothetical protein TL16_g01017 [Triparma laevis f. inornata]